MIEVILNDSCRLGLLLAHMPPEDALLGALICVSREDNLLLHPTHGEIAIHSLFELSFPPGRNAWAQCNRCKAWVLGKNMEDHEEYCRKHAPKPVAKSPRPKPPAPKPRAHRHWHKHPAHSGWPLRSNPTRPAQPTKTPYAPLAPQPDRPHPRLVAAAAARDAQLQAEVLRIEREAWEATSELPPDGRIKAAKQQALRLIAALSPSIKREVEYRFTSAKWAPLLALCPRSSESPSQALRPTPLNWPLPSPPD
ncbi:MAG: hypothetical protein ABSH34_38020 [Verrucomicrobiota bacterium]